MVRCIKQTQQSYVVDITINQGRVSRDSQRKDEQPQIGEKNEEVSIRDGLYSFRSVKTQQVHL